MSDPAFWHRIQFAFTLTYHYLFPQLTMGLAWFLVYWKWQALRTGDEKYNQAVRFWARIFGLNFAVGVVTGIPMEFQFGTNWAGFSKYSGAIIGQTLSMEGMFAFFLESAFIGALIFGEKKISPRMHFLAAICVALGSWLSGYFIITTNAFMQHPVGYAEIDSNGDKMLSLVSLSDFLLTRGRGSSSRITNAPRWSPAPLSSRRSAPSTRCAASTASRPASTCAAAPWPDSCDVARGAAHRRFAGEDGRVAPARHARGNGSPLPRRRYGRHRRPRPAQYREAAAR